MCAGAWTLKFCLKKASLVAAIAFLACCAFHAQAQTTLSATSLNFGNVVVGQTSAVKSVTLKNTQAVSLSITSITVPTASGYALAGSTSCPNPGSLAPGASCAIAVTLTPGALGAVAASLERLAELAAEELARRLAEFALRARLARRLRRVPHSSWVQGLWTRLALLSAWREVLLRLARARRFGRSAIERLRFLRNRGLGAWCVSRSGWGELRPGKLALGRLGRRVESKRTRPSRVTSKVRGV